ncbi:unnamed protein product [Clonostachys rosea f. rosea IK726]|uniref:Uncharacterized protein n=1 Tax=Clonostachys rosea f. rosea IK726 TaxID=1349383 RepID=A0ACA9T873_BIOOC|nr:unnamed protein product [Clonostachys rosea f. rosea IK726]
MADKQYKYRQEISQSSTHWGTRTDAMEVGSTEPSLALVTEEECPGANGGEDRRWTESSCCECYVSTGISELERSIGICLMHASVLAVGRPRCSC